MDPTYKGLGVPVPDKIRSPGPNFRLIFTVVGVFILIVAVVGIIAQMNSGGSSNHSQRLLYRLDALVALTSSASSSLQDDDLSKINAEVALVLTSDAVDVKKVIPAAKADKTLNDIKAEEADKATAETLKTAKLNGIYDTSYRTILKQKIETTYALAGEVSDKSSKTSVKNTLATLREHLSTYFKQL